MLYTSNSGKKQQNQIYYSNNKGDRQKRKNHEVESSEASEC